MLNLRRSAVWLAVGSVVFGGLLLGPRARADAPFYARFEVEAYTLEVKHGKTHGGVLLGYQTTEACSTAKFQVPPWVGDRGRELISGIGGPGPGKAERPDQWHHYWGCGAKIGPGQPGPDGSRQRLFYVGTYVPGPYPGEGSIDPVGRYSLVTPRIATVTLTSQQAYLAPPVIDPVHGDDLHGYSVTWHPVKGAVGYSVSTYAGETTWSNSNRDWKEVGAEAAVEQGILLRDTTCVIPGGMYAEPFRVLVDAISPDIRVPGAVSCIGYAHSRITREVPVSMGALPKNPALKIPDPEERMRPHDPFLAAIFDGDVKRVAEMVKSQPDLVNRVNGPITPLELAIWHRKNRTIRFLLDHGADPNLKDSVGTLPLIIAANFHSDPEMVELLLQRGARINVGEPGDMFPSPLHTAATNGDLEIVKVLLKAGANPNSRSPHGATPLDFALSWKRGQYLKVAALIRSYGGKTSPPQPPRPPHKPRPRKIHHKYPKPTKDAVFQALESAWSVKLLSIDPCVDPEEPWGSRALLGSTLVAGQAKQALVNALEQGIKESDGMEAGCFNPRHGILVQSPKATYFLIICYECLQIYVMQVDSKEPVDVNGDYGPELKLLTTRSPLPLFNKELTGHHIRVPKQ